MEGVEFGQTSAIAEMAELEEQKTEIKCSVSLDMRDGIKKLVESGIFSTISDTVEIALEELIHKIEEPYPRRETRYEIMQVADAFRAKMRKDILHQRRKAEIKCSVSLDVKDGIEKLVESGRFSTISDTVEIALEGLIHKIEDEPYARRETRYEIMQVADASRAKLRGQLT
jgi:Arc/MetJ-type ribon-helix-helix transcriptional regulator